MVRLNLSSLLILGASVAHAADCTTTQSVTQISTVPVYAGYHTGEVENTATAAYVPNPTFGLQPTFSLYVPIGEYDNAIGFNVEISDVSEGLTINADSWKLFSGDVNDFGQLDSSVFSVDGNTFEFVGLTKDPLFMITITGDIDDASYPSYSAQFVIYLNLADSDINLAKRDVLAITVNPTIENPNAVDTATSGAYSTASTASASVINSSVTGSTFVSQNSQDITVTFTSTPTVTANSASTSTITVYSTTLITTTSCFDKSCSTTVVPAVVSEVTTIIGDLTTVYTTTCPLSSAVEDNHTTETTFSTITHTITSCSDNKCSTYLAAVSEVSTVVDDVTTIYTTTCPLSEAPEATSTTDTTVAFSESVAATSTEAPVNTAVATVETSISSIPTEKDSTSTAINTITMTKKGNSSTEAPIVTSASIDSSVSVKTSTSSATVTIATDFAVFDAGAGHPTVDSSYITAVMGAMLVVFGF